MATNLQDRFADISWLLGAIGPGSRTEIAFDQTGGATAGFVLGTSGKALGVRFFAPKTDTFTFDILLFVSTAPGTAATLTVNICNHGAVTAKPGSSIASGTVSSGTTSNKWVKVTITGVSLTANTPYWIVVGDTVAATNIAKILSIGTGPTIIVGDPIKAYTSVDGFATNGTATNQPPAISINMTDSTAVVHRRGCPYTAAASAASSTLRRGWKINGLTEKLIISGVSIPLNSTAINGIEIYEGAAAPGSTPFASVSLTNAINTCGYTRITPVTLAKGTSYRVVWTFSISNSVTRSLIEDYASFPTELGALAPLGGGMQFTIDNGAGGWTDSPDVMPVQYMTVQDQVEITATPSSGSFGLSVKNL